MFATCDNSDRPTLIEVLPVAEAERVECDPSPANRREVVRGDTTFRDAELALEQRAELGIATCQDEMQTPRRKERTSLNETKSGKSSSVS